MGGSADSFYEYLMKLWILSGKTHDLYRNMYDKATQAVIAQLVNFSTPSNFVYVADRRGGEIKAEMGHLACFAGAMFALGAYHNATTDPDLHMLLGIELTKTCHELYTQQPTKIGPEVVHFVPGLDFVTVQPNYILRPETIESYFVLHWITGDPIYQEWGWEAFKAIESYCATASGGYAGIRDVTATPVKQDNLQQSFFMAETLKYFYLLFSPREFLSLDKWVLNTEAHPMRIWK